MQSAHDCAGWHPQDDGGLPIGAAFDIHKRDHLPVGRAKCIQRLTHRDHCDQVIVKAPSLLALLFKGFMAPDRASAGLIDPDVADDLKEPCKGRFLVLGALSCRKGVKGRLLHQIACRIRLTGQPQGIAQQPGPD